jgi:hypothetical protein
MRGYFFNMAKKKKRLKIAQKPRTYANLPEEEIAIKECSRAYANYGEKYKITDYVPDAIFDPVIILPSKPADITSIVSYGKPKVERKFPYYTDEYIELMTQKNEDGTYKHPDFFQQEIERRKNGLFFFNGNRLEYVTGHHYMTLQYWRIPVPNKETGRVERDRPFFIDAQRDWWYAMHQIRQEKRCLGMIYIGYRRSGKTVNAMAEGYWDTTENRESIYIIQSKNEDDAEEVFFKLIESWELLPPFLKPIDDGSTKQKKKLVFSHPKQRNVQIDERLNKAALNSRIQPISNTETKVDSKYISYFFKDEIAKGEKNIDVNEQWEIAKLTLMIGNVTVGKAVLTSTVEDSEKYGSEHAHKLWDRSDYKERGEDGFTKSGLYQFFLPAYYGYIGDSEGKQFVDEWGYSNVKAAKEYHERVNKGLNGEELISRKRKLPLNIDDAWINKGTENTFDARRLIEQKIWISKNKEGVRGNFEWVNGIKDGKVFFRPEEDGKWWVYLMPREEDQNKYEYAGLQRQPTRNYYYTGVDPFSHDATVRTGSLGAAITLQKSYPFNNSVEALACVYHYRPSTANELADDVIKQMVFYSSPTLAERQTFGLIQAIGGRNYRGFLLKNPLQTDPQKYAKEEVGFPNSSSDTREAFISMLQSYIKDRMGFNTMTEKHGDFYHLPTVQQLMEFDVTAWTKFDLVVALGLAVIAMRGERPKVLHTYNANDWLGNAGKKQNSLGGFNGVF